MDSIIDGIVLAFSWKAIIAIIAGLIMGQLLGAIPGLTATMGAALLVPYTYYFEPWVGIPMLLGMFKGTFFGSSITAVLVKTPGTPAAAATALDGYPLAQKGKGGKALQCSLYASIFGDTFSDLVLIFSSAPLAAIAVRFGPPEFTLLVLFSLLTLSSLAGAQPWKGLISMGIGVIFGLVGEDPIAGIPRLDFGVAELTDGFALVPTLIGFLAVSEVFLQLEKPVQQLAVETVSFSDRREDNRISWHEFRGLLKTLFRSSSLGTFIGAMPGLGATVAAFLSYNEAKRTSKNPEDFGKGALEGIAAPEAANNAVSGSNLIPLLAFGIPGDVTAALILGALLIQGITPGPLVFRKNPLEIYAIFTCLILANLLNLFIGKTFIRLSKHVVTIPKRLLFPAVLIIAAAGAYGTRGTSFDIIVVMGFGVLGYGMSKVEIPPIPLLIGFILAPILENSLRQSLLIAYSEGSHFFFLFKRPMFLTLLIIITMLVLLLFGRRIKLREQSTLFRRK
jgi:putative tricarboxylic transport membrane protein